MILYHHLEITARELDAKLWLASRAAVNAGHESLICNYGTFVDLVERSLVLPGLFWTKSLTPKPSRLALLASLSSRGFLVASQDEEGGFLADDYSAFAAGRFGEQSLRYVSAVFCWGSFDGHFLRDFYPGLDKRFFLVGSPRIDLWLPSMRGCWPLPAAAPQSRPFILIPFNFGAPIGDKSLAEVVDQARKAEYFERDPGFERQIYTVCAENTLLLYEFIQAVLAIAERFGDYDVIVRPHPAEDPRQVRLLFPGKPNLRVCREGSITAWVQHAAAVIHHGCTTAVEAVVAKKPLFTFVPLELPCLSKSLQASNRLGLRCTSVPELLTALDQWIHSSGQSVSPACLPVGLASRFSLDQSGYAADRMLDVINQLAAERLPSKGAWGRVRAYLAVRDLSRQLPSRLSGRHRFSPKREPFRQHSLQERVATICQAAGMPPVRCDVLSPDVVLIRPPR